MQTTLLTSLASMLRPIVRLTLKCGLSSQEFNEVTRSLFISVASEEYGIRGDGRQKWRLARLAPYCTIGTTMSNLASAQEDQRRFRWMESEVSQSWCGDAPEIFPQER